MRALVVEDDPGCAAIAEAALRERGFSSDMTDLGADAVELSEMFDYDLIVLDLMLPDISGYEVLRAVRLSGQRTPVLIISGLAGIEDRVRGLGAGADDYVTKPFRADDLAARARALALRPRPREGRFRFGRLLVDRGARRAFMDGVPIHLTGKEMQMLELMCEPGGAPHSGEAIRRHLYGCADEPELKIIEVFVCKLRKKLALASGGGNYITGAPGQSHALVDAETRND